MKGKFLVLFLILVLPSLMYVVLSTGEHKFNTLPYYGNKIPTASIIDGEEIVDTVYHTISDFSFTNQFNETITQDAIQNKIVVVDYFFTTCGSICPKMTEQLTIVQERFRDNEDVIILSHTVNPEHDSVEVLLDYANQFGAIKNKWHFLTGNKRTLYEMALRSYLINAGEDVLAEGGFLHSEMLVLIDKNKHIRGFYDGTDPAEVLDLTKAIKLLVAEEFIPKKEINS